MKTAPVPTVIPPHDGFASEAALDEQLTRPRAELVSFIRTLTSPLVILGAGGKMGPTLAVLAKRAADAAGHHLEVVAASRFSDVRSREWLEGRGVRTVAGDLLDPEVYRQLPDAGHVIYLVGVKFGTSRNPAFTWAVNTLVPSYVVARYPKAAIVALSTGNVYPLSPRAQGGSRESDPLTPVGEYANAAVARERLFEYGAARCGTRVALLRLFYAVEMRYGVITDLARQVWEGAPISVETGAFNCIWQGDANEMVLRALSLASSPPGAWNLCRPECFSVREVATRLGKALGREPRFAGEEASTALLGNAGAICRALGAPPTSVSDVIRWVAHWIRHGGRSLGKPTHFEVRDGAY